jgi:methyl-accepting chemotaxis protein
MKNVKLSKRLFVGFGILLLGMAALAAISLAGLKQIGGSTNRIVNDSLPSVYILGQIRSGVQDNLVALEEVVRLEDPVQRSTMTDAMNRRADQVTALLKEYESTIVVPEDRRLLNVVLENRESWAQARHNVVEALGRGSVEQAREILRTRGVQAFEKLMAAITVHNDWNKGQGDMLGKEVTKSVSSASQGIWATVLLAFVIGMGIAVIISRSVTVPLASLLDHVGRVGQGDLEGRCAYEAKDELGHLATDLNRMTDDLKTARDGERDKLEHDRQAAQELQDKVDILLAVVNEAGDLQERQRGGPRGQERRQRGGATPTTRSPSWAIRASRSAR